MSDVLRVFHAEVKPGMEEEFRRFFLEEALPMVHGHAGLTSVEVGLPMQETPRRFSMITRWASVDALKGFAGEQWTEAVIDPREEHLLARVQIAHYWVWEG